jgi:hypothetical protein
VFDISPFEEQTLTYIAGAAVVAMKLRGFRSANEDVKAVLFVWAAAATSVGQDAAECGLATGRLAPAGYQRRTSETGLGSTVPSPEVVTAVLCLEVGTRHALSQSNLIILGDDVRGHVQAAALRSAGFMGRVARTFLPLLGRPGIPDGMVSALAGWPYIQVRARELGIVAGHLVDYFLNVRLADRVRRFAAEITSLQAASAAASLRVKVALASVAAAASRERRDREGDIEIAAAAAEAVIVEEEAVADLDAEELAAVEESMLDALWEAEAED